MTFQQQVANRLKQARKDKGLTMQELADKCKLTKSAINNYEGGKRELSLKTISNLCAALEVTPELILTPNQPS